MKKLFFIVGLLSLLTFFSCQNEENVYYSCDEAEDAWVKENLSSIRKMETTEWFSIRYSSSHLLTFPSKLIVFVPMKMLYKLGVSIFH